MTSPVVGFKRLVQVFDQLGIPYLVTGSLASSVRGVARATIDIDVVADIKPSQVAPFAAELQSEFYADPVMMEEALRRGRAFNLIHFSSGFKFDIYPLSSDPYQQTQFARRKAEEAPVAGVPMQFFVASAEDALLSKLLWYKEGGEVSERQWHDAWGIVQTRRDDLDMNYLRQWARNLSVENLLDRLLSGEF